MPELLIRKVRATQFTELTDTGRVVRMIRTDFMIGEDGPFSVELPIELFTERAVREEIEKIAAELRKLNP